MIPAPDKVFLVEGKVAAEERGGIIVTEQLGCPVAIVVAVHPLTAERFGIQEGTKVIYNPYGTMPIKMPEGERLVISVDDILALTEMEVVPL